MSTQDQCTAGASPPSRALLDKPIDPAAIDGVAPAGLAEGVRQGVLRQIRGEFLEMPGLRLTLPQAQRLWGLEATTCEAVLAQLIAEKFLTVVDHRYSRFMEGADGRLRPFRPAGALRRISTPLMPSMPVGTRDASSRASTCSAA